LAPEVLLNRGYGQEVDWWSLGVIIWEMLTGLPTFYSENVDQMFRDIVRKQPVYPPYISAEAKSLLQQFLQKDPTLRLGRHGAEEVKAHPFFAGINWTALLVKTLKPPFAPSPTDAETARFFDDEFTSQAPQESSDDYSAGSSGSTFKGFTYSSTPESAKETLDPRTPRTPDNTVREDPPVTPQTA